MGAVKAAGTATKPPGRGSTRQRARAEMAARSGRYLIEAMSPEDRAAWDAIAPARGTGRPSMLQPARAQRIVDALQTGMPLMAAAVVGGIAQGTLNDWVAQGEIDADAGRDTAHARFALAVKAAEYGAMETFLTHLQTTPADWQRWAWMLERRWPEWFGRRDALQVQQSGEVRIVVEHVSDWHARDVIEVEAEVKPARRGRELDGQKA